MKRRLFATMLASFAILQLIPQDNVFAAAESYVNVEEGDYTIHLYTDSSLALTADGYDNCSNVSLEEYYGTEDQIWTVEKQDNGTYKIINYGSGKVLDVSGPGTYVPSRGTNVQIYESNDCPTEFWEFEQVDDGYRIICTSLSDDVCLDIQGQYNQMNAGCNVQTWSYTTNDNWCTQVFSLEKVLDWSTCSNSNPACDYDDAEDVAQLACPVNRACGQGDDFSYITFPMSYQFTVIKDGTIVRDEPYSKSDNVGTYYNGDIVLIDGIVRNEKDNIWLHVEDSGWIYIDNVSYLFEENALAFKDIIVTSNHMWLGPLLKNFYNTVKSDAVADIKVWLDPGGRGITYNVDIEGGRYIYTAEQIGNFNYGYLGNMIGLSRELVLEGGGFANVVSELKEYDQLNPVAKNFRNAIETVVTIANECSNYHCDTETDVRDVKAGYKLYGDYHSSNSSYTVTVPTFEWPVNTYSPFNY